jgi:hypothetical protein
MRWITWQEKFCVTRVEVRWMTWQANSTRLYPEEDPNPIMVVCKNKTGMFHPSVCMIRCLCAPCEAATAEGRHSVSFQEPQRFETHCGMHTAGGLLKPKTQGPNP